MVASVPISGMDIPHDIAKLQKPMLYIRHRPCKTKENMSHKLSTNIDVTTIVKLQMNRGLHGHVLYVLIFFKFLHVFQNH